MPDSQAEQVIISVQVPRDLRDRLKRHGKRNDLTLSQVVRRALSVYMGCREAESDHREETSDE